MLPSLGCLEGTPNAEPMLHAGPPFSDKFTCTLRGFYSSTWPLPKKCGLSPVIETTLPNFLHIARNQRVPGAARLGDTCHAISYCHRKKIHVKGSGKLTQPNLARIEERISVPRRTTNPSPKKALGSESLLLIVHPHGVCDVELLVLWQQHGPQPYPCGSVP